MVTPNPKVDAYIAKASPFAQPILLHLREVVHQAAPDAVEEIKWSRPFFLHRGVILGNMSAFKQHCSFGLWGTENAQALRADGVASAEGMGTFGRITSVQDLPPRNKLVAYVKQAAKLIDDGIRTTSIAPRQRVAKAEVEVPAALEAALQRDKTAAKKFAAMSPSCRREYTEWIADAKRPETLQKRVATALEWIAEGKSRNWKYESRA